MTSDEFGRFMSKSSILEYGIVTLDCPTTVETLSSGNSDVVSVKDFERVIILPKMVIT